MDNEILIDSGDDEDEKQSWYKDHLNSDTNQRSQRSVRMSDDLYKKYKFEFSDSENNDISEKKEISKILKKHDKKDINIYINYIENFLTKRNYYRDNDADYNRKPGEQVTIFDQFKIEVDKFYKYISDFIKKDSKSTRMIATIWGQTTDSDIPVFSVLKQDLNSLSLSTNCAIKEEGDKKRGCQGNIANRERHTFENHIIWKYENCFNVKVLDHNDKEFSKLIKCIYDATGYNVDDVSDRIKALIIRRDKRNKEYEIYIKNRSTTGDTNLIPS